MNTTKLLTGMLLAGSLALCHAQPILSTTNQTLSPPPASDMEQTIHDVKNPASWINWGGDLRVRNEYYNNGLSLGVPGGVGLGFGTVHSQDYFRFRGRIGMTLFPSNDVTLNVRLAAEPRDFLEHSTFDTYYNQAGTQWRYGIFDTLNVRWRNVLGLPATLTVGRQDIFLGDGFLVGDGTPEDGSFTTFLDSARLTYKLDQQKTTLDFIGIIQDARPDGWLPTLGPSTSLGSVPGPEPLTLTDQNEKGAILWVNNKSLSYANFDGYFIYKHDDILNAPVQTFGDNADLYTVGGRVAGSLRDHWKYSAEGAYQFGQKQEPDLNMGGANPWLPASAQTTGFRNVDAFATQEKLTYQFKDTWNDQLSLSYEFLSGDNPNTKNDEMFDVLWGRWPQWSELYNIYSYVQETRVGQTANLQRVGPTWTLDPTSKLEFSSSYFALFAVQDAPTRDLNAVFFGSRTSAGEPFSGTGDFRGHYFQNVLKYKFNQHISGHLWSEFLLPGDFYIHRQGMAFLRAEIMFTL